MSNIETKNAIITHVKFDTERGLSAWLMLDYGGAGQGFGGFMLYAPKGWKSHGDGGNYAGHFIWRCLEVVGVDDWSKLAGKPIRVKADGNKVHSIGHIIEDKWFEPSVEFEAMQNASKQDDFKSLEEALVKSKVGYLEYTRNNPDIGQYTITVQKTEGTTAAGLLASVKLDLKKVTDERDALLEAAKPFVGAYDDWNGANPITLINRVTSSDFKTLHEAVYKVKGGQS